MTRGMHILLGWLALLTISTVSITATGECSETHPDGYCLANAIGWMAADQVLVNGVPVTWQTIEQGDPLLAQNVTLIFENELMAIFDHVLDPYSKVSIDQLRSWSSSSGSNNGSQDGIAADYEALLPLVVVEGVSNLTMIRIFLNNDAQVRVADLSSEGYYDGIFGPGANVSIAVTNVTAIFFSTGGDNNELDDVTLAIIISCSVAGALLIIGVTMFFVIRNKRRFGGGGGDFYYDSTPIAKPTTPIANRKGSSYYT